MKKKLPLFLIFILVISVVFSASAFAAPAKSTATWAGATTTVQKDEVKDGSVITVTADLSANPESFDFVDSCSIIFTYDNSIIKLSDEGGAIGLDNSFSGTPSEKDSGYGIVMANINFTKPDEQSGRCCTLTLKMKVVDADALIKAGGAVISLKLYNNDFNVSKNGKLYYYQDNMEGYTDGIIPMVVICTPMTIKVQGSSVTPPTPDETWTVSFNTAGGTAVTAVDVKKGSAIGNLPITTRSGYTFTGWHTDSALTNKVTGTFVPTANTILYAGWTKDSSTPTTSTWTVAFNSNGGSYIASKTVTRGGSISLSEPTFSGFTFAGWYENAALTTKATSPYTPTSDITLYAAWTRNAADTPSAGTWTVSFNSNGGSYIAPKTVTRGSSTSLSEPTLYGFTFAGWYENTTMTTRATSPYTPYSDITLYAAWTKNTTDTPAANTWTVRFDSNGGSSVGDKVVTRGSSVSLPTPARSGYTFDGWYENSGLTSKASAQYTPNADITLYAKWTANASAIPDNETWTITFNSSGGSYIAPKTVTRGSSTSLSEPTLHGYTFDGWYENAALTTKATSPYTPSSDITLFAAWTKSDTDTTAPAANTWTVRFDSNGGSSVGDKVVTRGSSVSLPTPTRSGYTFDGWYEDSGLTGKASAQYTPNADVTLYAKWTANASAIPDNETWTITFNSNGGSYIANITVNKGSSASLPSPSMSGYTFAGWYTDTNLRNQVSSPYTPTSNITLCADWTKITGGSGAGTTTPTPGTKYTVSFNSNGGSPVASAVVEAGNAVSLASPSRSGYTFAGWYADSALSTKISSSTYTPSSDATLFAKWTAASSTNSVPKTGQENATIMMIVIMALLVCSAAVIIFLRYRKISNNSRTRGSK